MKILRIFQRVDLFIQGLLLSGVLLLLPTVFISLLFLFFLGIWQLFSALSFGIALRDRFRLLYLAAAVTFCSFGFSIPFIIDYVGWPDAAKFIEELIWLGLLNSLVAGVVYFRYSYRTCCSDIPKKLHEHDNSSPYED